MTMSNNDPDPAGDAEFDAELLSVFAIDGTQPDVSAEPSATPAAGDPEPAPTAQPPAAEPPQTPEPSPTPPPAQPVPTPPLPGLEQTPSPAPAPAEPPAPVVPDEKALELASLKAQLEAAKAQITHLTQAPPAGQPATPSGEQPPEVAPYALSIPDQVAAAIFNEDPVVAKKGLDHLVNNLATIIHTKVKADYQEALAGFRAELSSGDQEQRNRAEAARMQEDYYGAFPTHKAPVYEPIITQVAAKMAAEYPNAPWDENYRNALGARVNAAVAELNGQQPTATAPTPTPTPAPTPSNVPAKPAAFVPTTPRNPLERNSEEMTPDAVAELFAATD